MPGFDRNGPMGAGPMTGGARGFCNPQADGYPRQFSRRGFFGRGFRRGYGMYGMGRGAGRGFNFYPLVPAYGPPVEKEDELQWLSEQSNSLTSELDRINSRISKLKNEPLE